MKPFLLFAFIVLAGMLQCQTIALVDFATGLESPVDIDNAGDERLFVVERQGRIKIIHADGSVEPQPFLDIVGQVNSTSSEQGLLGMTFHPDFSSNGYFYVNYINGAGNGSTIISRFTISSDPDVADPLSESMIIAIPQPGTHHNGGDLSFGPDGYLWIAMGDGGPDHFSQDMTSLHGKILRIDVDGGPPYIIPEDNPYADADPALVRPEIWASGLRNPFRFSFDALTNSLFIADVGENAYEEINIWPANDHIGPNFGWRCYEGPEPYNTTGCAVESSYVLPAFAHPHEDGSCSVIGGYVYRGSALPGSYGKYIYTDFCHGRIHALSQDGNGDWGTEELALGNGFGNVAFGVDAAGELYLSNISSGTILKLVDPASVEQVRTYVNVFLEGPMDLNTVLMTDHLRANDLIPLTEPYTAMGKPQMAGGGGESIDASILTNEGNEAIVDWIRVELRSGTDPAELIATQQALLLRNGTVVMANGTSPLVFNVPQGPYYISVDHRNHLPIITATAMELTTSPITLDLRQPGTPIYGTLARKIVGDLALLWAGDVTYDGLIKYAGTDNDRDAVLTTVGGASPTEIAIGYHQADLNMDGTIRYTGANNDRDCILVNIGGVVPTEVRFEQMP